LRLLQREIPGDDIGDTVQPGARGAVAVDQRIGRDGNEADRRERGYAQRQPQFQIDDPDAAGREVCCLSQARSLPLHLRANLHRKKPG